MKSMATRKANPTLEVLEQIRDAVVGLQVRQDETNTRLDDVIERVDATNQRIDVTNKRLDVVIERVDETNRRVDAVVGRVDETNSRLDVVIERLDGLEKRVGALESRLAQSEMRVVTELLAVQHVLADVRDRLVDSLAQHDRVDDHERRISQLENRLPS